MGYERVEIDTADGSCPCHVLTPAGAGPWPAVIVYMDGLGMRQVMVDIGRRLADQGYFTLLPDLYYRSGGYEFPAPKHVFETGDVLSLVGPFMAATGPDKAAQDTAYLLRYLDTRDDVRGLKIGTVGFCMGGGMALAAAGTWPDRVAAVASYHGGGIASELSTSPHLLAPSMTAEVYIAGADADPYYPPDMADRMEQSLSHAGIRHRCEIYHGSQHGWMMPDFPVYDAAAAERGWREMLALFDRALR